MNLGRHELLQWVNSVVQAEYPSIESLSDGVAYCQIFEAVHPGSINATRMALLTKLPLDCMKNLRLLENAMKNLKIPITVSLDKMGNGRFQDNILFTQWLYNHARKFNGEALLNYQAYERRLQILEKQNKAWDEVNMHLLPNEAYMSHEQEQEQDGLEGEQEEVEERIEEIGQYVESLESDLKEKMELNWRMMHMIGRSIEERNTLYSLLEQIEKLAMEAGGNPVQKEILKILHDTPEDFKHST